MDCSIFARIHVLRTFCHCTRHALKHGIRQKGWTDSTISSNVFTFSVPSVISPRGPLKHGILQGGCTWTTISSNVFMFGACPVIAQGGWTIEAWHPAGDTCTADCTYSRCTCCVTKRMDLDCQAFHLPACLRSAYELSLHKGTFAA